MSDDEVDHELLNLLAKSLGIKSKTDPPEIPVLADAEFVCDNSLDVALDASSCMRAATMVYESMQRQQYSPKTWSRHALHPKTKDEGTVEFIFTMDLLNFCFWTGKTGDRQFMVRFRDQEWTGYWALVACLQRALDDGLPITSPAFWIDRELCTDEVLGNVFKTDTTCQMPLLRERMEILREAGHILADKYEGSFLTLLHDANGSAAQLVNYLVTDFPMFRDQVRFGGRLVRFYKRAQILVADLWAAFEGRDFGRFDDIDSITMFADYRIPQMLHSLGCLQYSPKLEYHIRSEQSINSGDRWEIEIRGCTIWCVEMLRRQILSRHKDAQVNAILIDFFLYDTCKDGHKSMMPHHKTSSIWY